MGMDADGILFWGISLGDSESLPEELEGIDTTWEDRVASAVGLPPDFYDENTRGMTREQVEEWYTRPGIKEACQESWQAQRDAIDSFEAEVFTTGSYEYPGVALAVKASIQRAEWSELKEPNLEVGPSWQNALNRLCVALNIPTESGKWYLGAFYG